MRARASSLDAALSAALVSATPPDVVGPVPIGDSWAVAVLHDRRAPSLADPEVREEAVRSIIDDVVRRTAAGLVREVGPL